MKLTQHQLIHARIDAATIAEKAAVAYWVNDQDKAYHITDVVSAFEKLAKTRGYEISKREVIEELAPDTVILV
jgi:hypothetical protein